eukprot:scaffold44138_cov55-Attheya_sp.AAC.1
MICGSSNIRNKWVLCWRVLAVRSRKKATSCFLSASTWRIAFRLSVPFCRQGEPVVVRKRSCQMDVKDESSVIVHRR